MKFTEAKARIVGVHIGEAELSLLPGLGKPPIRAKVALIGSASSLMGSFEMNEWSDRAVEALRTFVGVLEEEALAHVFEVTGQQPTEGTEPGAPPAPPQF
jgi:hypothetical protein